MPVDPLSFDLIPLEKFANVKPPLLTEKEEVPETTLKRAVEQKGYNLIAVRVKEEKTSRGSLLQSTASPFLEPSTAAERVAKSISERISAINENREQQEKTTNWLKTESEKSREENAIRLHKAKQYTKQFRAATMTFAAGE